MPDLTLRDRIRPLALAGIAALSTLLTSSASAAEGPAEDTVEADVMRVAPLRPPGRGLPWRARVTVRLDDGTRVRMTYRRPFPRVGERVQLRLADGALLPVR